MISRRPLLAAVRQGVASAVASRVGSCVALAERSMPAVALVIGDLALLALPTSQGDLEFGT